MYDDRFAHIPRPSDHAFQCAQIMSVDGAEITKAHLGKNVIRNQMGFQPFFDAMIKGIKRRKMAEHLSVLSFKVEISGLDTHGLQHFCRSAHIFRDRHVVVVKDHNDRLSAHGGVGQAFKGQSARHGAVADHSADIVVLTRKRSGMSHSKCNGDRV